MPANLLANEASPYLLQHKDNPVHWHAWNRDALDRAKAENKPILLSVGYAACHWCHVMAHESFESGDIAKLMNELFVNIKVDREERPDLDGIYQTALALMGQQGGWPLTMFLTPDARPFWGGTYFPPSSRWGRPGFPEVLQAIAKTYRDDPEKIEKNVEALNGALENFSKPDDASWAGIQSAEQIDGIAEAALRIVDPLSGGTRGAPKFPQPAFFNMLWRAWRRTGRDEFKQAVTVTLDNMCQGGIYDHLGGGFARYSTDEGWLVPHFEKMLYDNGQLLELLAYAWADTGSALYRARARETVEWLMREMLLDGGDFAGTLDADSEGGEGTFYVWREDEIDGLLGDGAEEFKQAYDVAPGGNWEGSTILNRLHDQTLPEPETEARLRAMRQTLWAARETRERPGLDDKVLADWNGLMITGLAVAGGVFAEPGWIAAARRAFQFVVAEMDDGGRLRHSWRGGTAKPEDVLDDYAHMARAALALHQSTGEAAYLGHAETWTATANRRYWDEAGGGYFFSPDDAADLIVRTRTAFDNATPAGNGAMIDVLARLHHLTGNEDHRRRAEETARSFTASSSEQLINMPSALNGIETMTRAIQVAVIGDPAAAETVALADTARRAGRPNLVLSVTPPDAALPRNHPAAGKTRVDGRPAAYVCVGPACGLPQSSPEDLMAELQRL